MDVNSMVSAHDVAKLFLSWANRDGDLITNLKMQKLLYYAQVWHLVNFKVPLFSDKIEAWESGPAIPNIYHYFKDCGHSPINYEEIGNEEDVFSSDQLEYLHLFYDKFIGFSAHELVNMSHNELPWKDVFEKGEKFKIISHKSMKEFYPKLLEKPIYPGWPPAEQQPHEPVWPLFGSPLN
uniref:Antitoxin SocA-like Panacea domain-containing protein n=1 Tax=viral metagenome TaxID=1070528 RepID=A0A6M3XW07_9ZZZZ